MILQVGKKYVSTYGTIYTIISTSRKCEVGYNIVAESVDGTFRTFTKDGKHYAHDTSVNKYDLIKEYRPKLRVQFTIDLPEQLEGLPMDEIDALMHQRLIGLAPLSGPCFDRGDLDNAKIICSYEN